MRVHIRTVAHVMDEQKIPKEIQEGLLIRLIGMIEEDEVAMLRNRFDNLRRSLLGDEPPVNGQVYVKAKKMC